MQFISPIKKIIISYVDESLFGQNFYTLFFAWFVKINQTEMHF